MTTDRVKVVVTGQALTTLQRIARQRGVSVAEALARAIGNEQWLTDEVAAESRIYAENKRDNVRCELNVDDMFHSGV